MSQLRLKALLSIATGVACYFTMLAASAQSLPATAAADAFMADKAALEQGRTQREVPNSVLVKFRAGVARAEQDSIIAAFGGQRVRNFNLVEGLVHIRVPQNAERAVQALSANPRVEYAELDGVLNAEGTMPNDPGFSSQWGFYNTGQVVNGAVGISGIDIRMPEAWTTIAGSTNCLVAVIDSGVLWTHADFAYSGGSNIWANNDAPGDLVDNDGNAFVDDTRGWDFYANDNNPNDENGHGTHVAGIIAAAGNNGVGVTGTAWVCKIMPLRFLSRSGSGATSDAIAALNYAVMEGARVSNNSWGGGGYSQALSDSIAAAGKAGHVFVAAAGNSAVNIDTTPSYPAAYDHTNIITVAAIDSSGNLASFTNTGSKRVDIAAPGVNILSTYKTGYAYLNGTSMAAPFVSGTLGLLASQQGSATPETLISKVLSTGTPDGRYTGKILSGSLLDAGDALAVAAQQTVPAAPTNLTASVSGTTVTLQWRDNATNETDYEISRSDTSPKWLAANTQSYSEQSVAAGTYTYAVRAYNTAGYSPAASVQVTVASPPPSSVPPIAPTGFTGTNNADGSATLGWVITDTSLTSFRLERSKLNKNNIWSAATSVSLNPTLRSYRDAPGSGTFRYELFAVNPSGETAALLANGTSTVLDLQITRK